MKELESVDIQETLDKVTSELEKDSNFISVFFTEEDKFVIQSLNGKVAFDVPPYLEVYNRIDNTIEKFPIEVQQGEEIVFHIGDVNIHPPLKIDDKSNGQYGGDQCRNQNSMNYYGTISFFAGSVSVETEGNCFKKCTVKPGMVSNNHVIGRDGVGKPGEKIWTVFNPHVADLKCVVPYKCNTSIDYASATVNDTSVKNWEIRDIGKINKIVVPKRGQSIKKYGARSGFTTGKITGLGNIKVGKYMFYKIFSTSKGFGCPGDSGSSVLSDKNDLLGIYSWGEKGKDCPQQPVGYFWPMIVPKKSITNTVSYIENFTIEE